MQYEIKLYFTTENIDSKVLVMLDKWYHFSIQRKIVLVATCNAFYVCKSFAKYMPVPDGQNKFILKEFYKSTNINIMAEPWAQISQSYKIGFWKNYAVIFHSRFSMLWEGRRKKELKEQFPVLAEQGSFDEPEELHTVQFSRWKKAVKWGMNADTLRVWACYLGSRERLL